jgi:uncharacterized protein (DUF885 family)
MIATVYSAPLVALLCAPARAETPAADTDAAKLKALFDQEWQWTMREYPEFATAIGDNRYNDKLTDLSVPAMDLRKGHDREYLRRLREIDRARLTGQDVVSYDVALAGAMQDPWLVPCKTWRCSGSQLARFRRGENG